MLALPLLLVLIKRLITGAGSRDWGWMVGRVRGWITEFEHEDTEAGLVSVSCVVLNRVPAKDTCN